MNLTWRAAHIRRFEALTKFVRRFITSEQQEGMDRCDSVSSTNRLRTYVNPKRMMVRSNLLFLDSYSSPDRLKRASVRCRDTRAGA